MCVEKLHRLPSEVPFSYDEAIMLLALAVDQDKQTNICPDCLKKQEHEIKECYRCGAKYSDSGHVNRVPGDRSARPISRLAR